MRVTVGMICLNEEEYLEANLRQHYDLADEIIIVEGADRLYPRDRVTANGLSSDCTASIVKGFPDPDKKIKFIQHGFTGSGGAQAKCELRNRYMELAKPGILWAVDADEFWREKDVATILEEIEGSKGYDGWRYPTTHFWRDSSQFVTGGYYDMAHTRWWRFTGSERYRSDHNVPQLGRRLLRRILDHDRHIHPAGPGRSQIASPCCYHFGFCKQHQNMVDKTSYYVARGEKQSRPDTTQSRMAWFCSDKSIEQDGLTLWPYGGPIPEALTQESLK